jgi:glutaminase
MPKPALHPLTRLTAAVVFAAIATTAAHARGRPDPSPADLAAVVQEAHAAFKDLKDGANADYIPELTKVPSELFGVAIVTVKGDVYVAGDVDYAFSIQSVSKPFTAALVMEELGADTIKDKIGVEPTGLPFNSVTAVEQLSTRAVNPLVNAGAMAAVSLVPAKDPKDKFGKIIRWYEAMAGGVDLPVLNDVYASEAATNQHNVAIAWLLKSYDRFYDDPVSSTDVYTKQCSIGVTARQLAMMGATLANGGVNPATGRRVMKAENVPKLLAVMTMAGFYDEAGEWAWSAGLAGKTGVGGGIVAVVPGKFAIVGFSPRLNKAGNSVRAMKAIEHISTKFGLSMFEAH